MELALASYIFVFLGQIIQETNTKNLFYPNYIAKPST